MIRLKPNPEIFFSCPECGTEHTLVKQIKFFSIHVMAESTCQNCGFDFFQVLPVGHTVDYPLAIGKQNNKLYQRGLPDDWLTKSLMKSHQGLRSDDVQIRKMQFKKYNNVIILNTLDSLYGHVLLKLYNAFYHLNHHPDFGLILIIPKTFEWLIPAGCAEVWVVNLRLGELIYNYDSIQQFIAKECLRFDVIHLSKAYSHQNLSSENVTQLTGVFPFNLANFSYQKPTISFILREDRWWFTHKLDYWLYRLCRKLKVLSFGSHILSLRQNQLIKRTIRQIRSKLPEANFHVIGLGKTGSFAGFASDERQTHVNAVVERGWCDTYAKSHVVVGVHGSNMLLPTALGAGCVEILPEDRYGNIIQDISVRYADRLQLFFYRFADQFSSPKSVSSKVVSMINDFESYKKNMCINTYPSEPPMTILPTVHDGHH
ncbi:MAG TPA: hypothetical protein VFE57_05070 [Cyclobacteriaceae bacterium]|jgi:hypothetical protein|nr:hypothetical protein [Cyclobacteriaceae bacterium]